MYIYALIGVSFVKKLFGVLLILFFLVSGISEVIFLNNGRIVEGEITDINEGIVIVEVDDYKHIFSTSNISYIFFTQNINFKNGFYLKNGIVIKKTIPLRNMSEGVLEFSDGSSKLFLNKKDIVQLSFIENSNEPEIKIEDSLIDFTEINSINDKEHLIKTPQGKLKLNYDNLEKYSKKDKEYILNKDNEIYFLKDIKITEKGIKPFVDDEYYIKDFNSLIKIDASFDGRNNASNDIYTIKTKEKTYSGKFVYGKDSIIINKQEIKSGDIVSINKNLIFKRKMDYFSSGYNENEYFIMDNYSNLYALSEKGLINKEKVIEEFDTNSHYISVIRGTEDHILLRDNRSILLLDAKTFEVKEKREFSHSFLYKLRGDLLIIYSTFSTKILVYDMRDLTLLKEYNLDLKVSDIEYWNEEIYIINSSLLYKYHDGEFKVLEDFGTKLYNLVIINNKIYLIAYDSVFVYNGENLKEIKIDPVYGYEHDGENLFIVSKNKISSIKNDELAWEKNFEEENYRSSVVIIDENLYTIYGDNLYKFDKEGNSEIIFNYDFSKSIHNLYKLKDKFLLITCQDEFLQFAVAD